jgi:hypothetical protein
MACFCEVFLWSEEQTSVSSSLSLWRWYFTPLALSLADIQQQR